MIQSGMQMTDRMSLYDEPAHVIRRAQQRVVSLFNEHLGHQELTAPQFTVLLVAQSQDRMEQKDIAAKAFLDPMTVSGIIRRLEKKNLLRRDQSSRSRRGHMITLTDSGRALISRSRPIFEQINTQLLADLSGRDAEVLLTLLSKVGRTDNRFNKVA